MKLNETSLLLSEEKMKLVFSFDEIFKQFDDSNDVFFFLEQSENFGFEREVTAERRRIEPKGIKVSPLMFCFEALIRCAVFQIRKVCPNCC